MWKFYQPVDIVFGAGKVEKLAEIMEEKKLDKALIVADPFTEKCGLAKKVMDMSKGKVVGIISEVEPNPSIQNVDACIAKAKETGAECIIAIGGGSAMDCAKSTAAGCKMNLCGSELLAGAAVTSALPVIAVPTTAGTGSEVTAGAVISDKEKGIKAAVFSPAIFPVLAVVDPELTYTCPPAVTASSGIDVLAHALDALTSVKASPATDALAVRAAKMVFENLEKAYLDGNDKAARDNMSEACVTAGLAFSQTGTTGSHACSYILTSKFGIPHGEACAFTLDSWFRENAKVRPQLNEFAKMMGFSDADEAADEVAKLRDKLKLRSRLSEIGVTEADLDEIAKSSNASGNMTNNIAKIGVDGIRRLFAEKA
ncbi:hypothetical protein C0033_20065 [Clostridium sp. chh4-2]|uniref:iron-containing alcohol dehydrogenase family protein n=1 Tax=Clostridium sp. chh4-2 TaxID=2067550 RepID=UPI000CCF1E9D|nr:iron-containing alcohol dehydrogenase family protein [Clostridium sp. chh4-2]PNV60141.1 hypothetical protein C0033_20065 [Clostridium sp. chh4-2]